MDKSWISKDRDSLEYEIGVEKFLIFAEGNCEDPKTIPCPCVRCANFKKFSVKIIRGHMYEKGFSLGYVDWIWHGEKLRPRSSGGSNIVHDEKIAASEAFEVCEAAYHNAGIDDDHKDSYDFKRFVADAEQPLFKGSECTKLDTMLRLHNWKARFGISDSAFSDLLSSVGSFLPEDHVLPTNSYEAKKTLNNLGLEYIKIHACPNDCVLYRGVNENETKCPKCSLSRWKVRSDGTVRYNVPAKVMWYFPIIPRFKRMFKSTSTSELITWHANKRVEDGQMRHPADSPSWRNVDYRWPTFGSDPRNLRLALSADGINPHTNGLSNRYSCWPVVLVTYNLPPWLCMKRKFMMLTILVSGPHEPGNNLDVFLQPLIDDLKKLWVGEPNVYDANTKSLFTLRAILLWTINDFPAYGNLSGCVNKGYMSCPVCGDDTVAKYLPHSRKMCFQGHRRYLPRHHPYRRKKAAFNGEQEFGHARQPLSGEEVLAEQEKINFAFGKQVKKWKKVDCAWKKKSIFFELEYWKYHHVRHCIDVMHVEKNVCDNLIGTLLNLKFKSKDGVESRLDMQAMGVRPDLAPEVGGKRTYLPPASFTLTKAEKRKVLSSLSRMKLPYGHSSNIKNCVSMLDLKILGLKSHDCHILIQQLLPVAIRNVLPKNVRVTIIRLCFFFNTLCNKVVDVSKLDKLQSDVVLTLCELEAIFPPSFFDVMVHLLVHLVRELRLCGPVFYRWMYPFERFNKVLKSYVRNRYHPEGCIAERYLKEESVEFCSEFVRHNSTTAGLPKDQGKLSGPISAAKMKSVAEKERDEAHLHVLLNNLEVVPYILRHKRHLERIYEGKKKTAQWLIGEHNRAFADWFEKEVSAELRDGEAVSETVRWLAGKPSFSILTYEGYAVDGVRYFTKARDDARVVQNSGISLVAKTIQVSSAKDLNPVEGDMTFYGRIEEIWELDYHAFQAPLFLCRWADSDRGVRVDDLSFTLVDLSRQGHKNDKYVSVDQVKQVFYVDDPIDSPWSIVLTSTTRDYHDVYNDDELGDTVLENPPFCTKIPVVDVVADDNDDEASLGNQREDGEGIWVKN